MLCKDKWCTAAGQSNCCSASNAAGRRQAHLSGDIHSAGSIVFYVLTGGVHAFGRSPLDQQLNIRNGEPKLRPLRQRDAAAADLVGAMVRRAPAGRPTIAQVRPPAPPRRARWQSHHESYPDNNTRHLFASFLDRCLLFAAS